MKKRIFSAFLAVLMIALLVPVNAFASVKEIKGVYVGVAYDSIIETVLGAKKFSRSGNVPEGMKLSGTWAYKENVGDNVFEMTLSGKPTKAGTYNFSVTYKKDDGTVVEKVDYTVIVGEEAPFDYIQSINLYKWPDKLVYYLGDHIDLSGMVVRAIAYKLNPKTKMYEPIEVDVTDLVWASPAVFTSDEAQTVKIFVKAPCDQYGTIKIFEQDFRVTFKFADPNEVLRMEVYQKPEKTTYTVGETLDTTGMVIRLHKGDGSAEDITEGFKTDVTKLEEAGTKTVTVTYGEGEKAVTTTFDVTVNEKVEEPVSSSSSSSEPEPPVSSEPEVPESSEPEVPESSEPEVPESSEPEVPESSEPEVPESSEPEVPESSEEEIVIIGGEVEEPEEKGGVPVWAWIIIVLLVVLIGAAVGLFIIGRRRIDD